MRIQRRRHHTARHVRLAHRVFADARSRRRCRVAPAGGAGTAARTAAHRLVGRERELQALGRAWAAGATFLVLGEAGIGKSRLLGEFADGQESVTVVKARPGDAGVPCAVMARLLRAVLERHPLTLTPARTQELALLLPELGTPVAWSGPAQRVLLQRTIEASLAEAMALGLRALIVDDLHFTDDASLELLQALIEADSLAALCWGLAQRPADAGRGVMQLRVALEDDQRIDTVALAPLLRRTAVTMAMTTLLGAAGAAQASLLVNGSFELGAFVANGDQTMSVPVDSTAITGWTVVSDTTAWIRAGNPFGLSASNGSYFLDLTDYAASAPYGGVTQTFATLPGASYLLTFDLGGSNTYGRPDAITASAAGTSISFTTGAASLNTPNNDWYAQSMSFVATGASTVLTLQGSLGHNYIGLDNVSVVLTSLPDTPPTPAIPEPATWSLLVGGLGALALLRRRRSRD